MSNILVIRRKKIKMVKLYSTLIKNGLKEKTMLAVLLSPTDVRNDANLFTAGGKENRCSHYANQCAGSS